MKIRTVVKRAIWNKGEVELKDASLSNENYRTRLGTLSCIMQTTEGIELLLFDAVAAENHGFSTKVLEFIRFGGDLSRQNSLRYQPMLPYLDDLKGKKKQEAIRVHRRMVATFRLKIPVFVRWDLEEKNSGASFYSLPLEVSSGPPDFWEPEKGYTLHSIFRKENSRAWETFQKLQRLGIPSREAATIFGSNVYQECWVQGNLPDFQYLFTEGNFKYSQTLELMQLMHQLLQKYQPEFVHLAKITA